mgnify:CR=1 FL=1
MYVAGIVTVNCVPLELTKEGVSKLGLPPNITLELDENPVPVIVIGKLALPALIKSGFKLEIVGAVIVVFGVVVVVGGVVVVEGIVGVVDVVIGVVGGLDAVVFILNVILPL